MTDWYRNPDWTDEIAEAFEKKLARARSGKAQYLKIQGLMLAETHPEAAIGLLERCAQMEDEFETAPALSAIGGIRLTTGDIDGAIEALERAIDAQMDNPSVFTNAPRDFCFLVALHEREEKYGKALKILEAIPAVSFGAAGYSHHGALAVIHAHQGNTAKAGECAAEALKAALDTENPLEGIVPMHPDAVVKQPDNPFTERLIAIHEAAGKP